MEDEQIKNTKLYKIVRIIIYFLISIVMFFLIIYSLEIIIIIGTFGFGLTMFFERN